MALPRNKLVPVLAVAALSIIGLVLYKQFGGGSQRPGAGLSAPVDPTGGKAAKKGLADADTPEDTLRSVVAANTDLRRQAQDLMRDNERYRKYGGMSEEAIDRIVQTRIQDQLMKRDAQAKALANGAGVAGPGNDAAQREARRGTPGSDVDLGLADPAATVAENPSAAGPSQTDGRPKLLDRIGKTFDDTLNNASAVIDGLQGTQQSKPPQSTLGKARQGLGAPRDASQVRDVPGGLGFGEGGPGLAAETAAPVAYKLVAPLGYEPSKVGSNGSKSGALVRTNLSASSGLPPGPTPTSAGRLAPDEFGDPHDGSGGAGAAAGGGDTSRPGTDAPVAFFTIPQNATLTRVSTMTSLIGRVPIDGRVTDPMQFKVIIGRENLAANGHYVPDEISGIVASGVAVGDMAMSCSEGKIYSLTFVFTDGTVHTVNASRGGGGAGAGSGAPSSGGSGAFSGGRQPLGYISDLWGNPCIAGKFVTNAPAYLTDVVGLRSLGVAARAYAAAQTSTTQNAVTGSETSSVTGNRGAFVMGQAAAGAVDDVTNWIMSRLKNSFDAVVTPSGQKIVVHLDQEVVIDKNPLGRRLDHRRSNPRIARAVATGAQYGLD